MKNKKVIFGIVLFLLIGLAIFTFANPAENEEILDDKDNDKTEEKVTKDDNDDQTEETDEQTTNNNLASDNTNTNVLAANNQSRNTNASNGSGVYDVNVDGNNGSSNNGGNSDNNQTTDNKYNEALKAVEKAEATRNQADVDAAAKLVADLESSTNKTNLENRLADVQNIIDVMAMIAKMELDLEEADARGDIVAISEYKSEQNVAEKIATIKDEELLEELTSRYEAVSVIVDDDENPEFDVQSGTHFNKETDIEVTDENFDYVMYRNNDKDTEYTKVSEDKFTLTDEGTYHIIAYDKAMLETEIYVAIDKTTPVISGVENNGLYNSENGNLNVVVTDKFLQTVTVDGVTYTRGESEEIKLTGTNNEGFTFATNITEEGTHTIEATDKVGNKVTYTFTIDKTAPEVVSLGVTDINEYQDAVGKLNAKIGDTVRVLVYIKDNEILDVEPTVKVGNKKFKATYREKSKAYYADIKLTEDMNLSDGILEFEVYGYADKAGNVGDSLNQDKVNMANYPSVTIDNTPIQISHLYTLNYTYHNDETYTDKNYKAIGIGQDLYVELALDEMPVTTPQLKVGDADAVNMSCAKASWDESITKCDAHVIITEDMGLEQGKAITFEITGVEDATGNITEIDNTYFEGKDLSNEKYGEVIFDTTVPEYNYLSFRVDGDSTSGVSTYYANANDTLYLSIASSKKLNNDLLFVITDTDGNEFETGITKDVWTNNRGEYVYQAFVKVPETLVEGKLTATVKNVVDLSGNEATKSLVSDKVELDKTAPFLEVKDYIGDLERKIFSNVSFKLSDSLSGIKKISINGQEISYIVDAWGDANYNDIKGYLKDGINTVVLYDAAGNKTTEYEFTYDVTAPEISYTLTPDGVTNGPVTVTLTANEPIADLEGWTKIDNQTFTKVFEQNEKVWMIFEDLAGNKTENTLIEVKRIDKVNPSFVGLTNNKYFNHDVTYKVTKADENNGVDFAIKEESVKTIIIDGVSYNEKEAPKTISGEGKHTIKVIDKALNESEELTFVIDETNPVLEVKEFTGNETSKLFSKISFKLKDNMSIASVYINGVEKANAPATSGDANYNNIKGYLKDGLNTVVLYDLAGNASEEYVFTYDNEAPTVVESFQTDEGDKVKYTVKFSEAVAYPFDNLNWRKVSDTEYYTYFYKTKDYTINFNDLAGNEGTYTFNVVK